MANIDTIPDKPWNWDYIEHSASCLGQDRTTEVEFVGIDGKLKEDEHQPNLNMTCRSVIPPKYVPFMEAERVCRHCVRYSLFKDVIDIECDHCARTREDIEDDLPILECGCDECREAYQQSEAEAELIVYTHRYEGNDFQYDSYETYQEEHCKKWESGKLMNIDDDINHSFEKRKQMLLQNQTNCDI
jgi:hypothetical protein